MELTDSKIENILDVNYFALPSIGYTLPRGIDAISDINLMLKSLLLDEVIASITIADIRLRSNLTTNKTIRFTKKSFLYTILGFVRSRLIPLGNINGYIQSLPGTYKNEKPIKITGIDKIHLKCSCISGSNVNGIRQPILYSFALDKRPGKKIHRELTFKKLFKKNKTVLSHITFYLEDDDHKLVDFNQETMSFTCQLVKI